MFIKTNVKVQKDYELKHIFF